MSTSNTRAVPTRAIIMILISLAILCAAVGTYKLITRDNDPQAALNAQEAKLSEAAGAPPAAEALPICLISVARAPVDQVKATLTKAGSEPTGATATWPARPAAPKVTTVYFPAGAEGQAKTVSTVLEGAEVAPRPGALRACSGSIAVAVVRG